MPTKKPKPFQLVSDFSPAGDQPRAIAEVAQRIKKGDGWQTLLGATGTGKTFTVANIVQELQKPTLVIAPNKTLAAQLCAEFRTFFPNNAVSYFVSYYDYYQPEAYLPASDTFIEKEATINDEINHFRHAATQSLLTRRDVLIVASVSCIYGLGDVESYESLAVTLEKGEHRSLAALRRRLVDIQYTRSGSDFRPGMFHLMGDTLEIFPPSTEYAIRVEFFGDEIEGLSAVDAFTGEVLEELQEVTIFPAKHEVTTPEKIANACGGIEKDLNKRLTELEKSGRIVEAHRLRTRVEHDLEMLREVGYVNGIENYTRYLGGRPAGDPPATLLEYFPDDFLVFIDESHLTIPQLGAMHEGNRRRKTVLIDHGFRMESAHDNRPLRFEEFEKFVPRAVCISATPGKYEFLRCANMEKSAFHQMATQCAESGEQMQMPQNFSEQILRPTGLLDPVVEVLPSKGAVARVLAEIQARTKKSERTLVTTLTKKSAERLTEFLREKGVRVKYLHSDVDTIERIEILRQLREGAIDVVVGINLLREGLDLPEVSLVCILDADSEGFLRSRDALIQTIGRAARNAEGRAMLFADRQTTAMREAIAETQRRRKAQRKHNAAHGITPKTVKKNVTDITAELRKKETRQSPDLAEIRAKKVKPDRLPELLRELEEKMELASQNLEFERAAELRDEIEMLRRTEGGAG